MRVTVPTPSGHLLIQGASLILYAAFLGLAGTLWWISIMTPTQLPFLAPWEFSPLMVATGWAVLWFYLRGLFRTPLQVRPRRWQQICFLTGLALTYFVLQTRFEYMAQHMFFLNRAQHIVMHHLGPMLIVLGWPWDVILRGAPAPIARIFRMPALLCLLKILRQPVLAAALFVGLVALWLIPTVHFRAMINPFFYSVMNWSMVLDGVIFWSMVLDPRTRERAGVSVFTRALTTILIVPPQILIGAIIVFSRSDLYDFYHWCGRIYPTIDPMTDQTLGGLIVWIPSAMTSIMALLLVLNFARQNENTIAQSFSPNPTNGD